MAHGMNSRGLRRSRRVACKAKVQLSWVAASGELCGCLGTCTDISQDGMQINVQAAIPLRSSLHFLVPNSPLQGSGSVRSCVRTGSKYAIGLTFSTPLRVDPATTPIPGVEVVEVFSGAAGEGAGKQPG
jgi:hypothetical protein